MWGLADHARNMFAAAGTEPSITVETVDFSFSSVEESVRTYAEEFGPFVITRSVIEPQGRWDEFLGAFDALVRRFNTATDGTARVQSSYFVISVDR